MAKNLILGREIFVSKIWLGQSLDIMVSQLSSCTIAEKINDPILRKLSDGRTDGRIDGRVISEEAARLTPSVQ